MQDNQNIVFEVGGEEMTFIFVEGTGEEGFLMGGESLYNDSLPVHAVCLSDYWIGKYLVTQAIWEVVMDASACFDSDQYEPVSNPSFFQGNKKRPSENVSWDDIMQEGGFIDKLNALFAPKLAIEAKKRGWSKPFRFDLPTEAQWEYAAKGGKDEWKKGYLYAGSNEIDEIAWYDKNSHDESQLVGLKKPNGLGLYDMSGNVWEWCRDGYDSEYYATCNTSSPSLDPENIETGSFRVFRGGSWFFSADHARLASRNSIAPTGRHDFLGLRLRLA